MSALFTPLTVKHVHFRNRIAMPPMVRLVPAMSRELTETGGQVTDPVIEHYRRRAAAGTSLIIVEATAVDPGGRVWPQGLNAYADEHIPGLARLAEAIRAEGAVAAIQLVHGGAQGSRELSGGELVGPSAVAAEDSSAIPRALTIAEIQAIEERFAAAAARAVAAGFQAVELHGAHGYLLDSFLSRQTNRRTDAYGGDLAGRMRFLLETCRQVKVCLAGRALLDCRISIFNKRDEGLTAADFAQLLRGLEGAGIDLLHISTDGAFKGYFGGAKTIGQWAKESTAVPVIVAGGLRRPQQAERAIAEGHADLAAVGTAMLKDGDWSRHAQAALMSS